MEAMPQVTPDASKGYDDRFSIFSIGSPNSGARIPFTVESRESWIPPTVMERHIASKARSFFQTGQFYCSVSNPITVKRFCCSRCPHQRVPRRVGRFGHEDDGAVLGYALYVFFIVVK